MIVDQAKAFLKALGCKPEYTGGQWVTCGCPLAPWLHASGKDSNPSFGISIKGGERSHYNCFTCQSGSAEELLQTLEMYVAQSKMAGPKYNFKAARALLDEEALENYPLPEFTEFDTDESQEFYEWPGYFLENFMDPLYNKRAMEYLIKRHVPIAQIKSRGILYDPKRDMVVFPFYTVYGKLAGARGRCINETGKPHHDYSWNKTNNTGLVWYNEDALNHDQPIVIVEGQFDYLTVARVYPYTMANLTAKPSFPKLKKLQQCPGVVLLLDNDDTGKKATERYIDYCQSRSINVGTVELPQGIKDPDKLGSEGVAQLLSEFGLVLPATSSI